MTLKELLLAGYFPLYVVWSVTWFAVMLVYGKASLWTWRSRGGNLRTAREWALAGVIRYAICTLSDLRLRPERVGVVKPQDSGYLLRIYVAISSFNIGVLGFTTSLVDRGSWQLWQHAVVIFGVVTSTIAGQGHLLLAWNHNPHLWRRFHLVLVGLAIISSIYRLFYH